MPTNQTTSGLTCRKCGARGLPVQRPTKVRYVCLGCGRSYGWCSCQSPKPKEVRT